MKKLRWLNGCALVVFALLFGNAVADAQQTKPQPKQGDKNKPADDKQDGPSQERITTINVNLPVTVSDKNNAFVINLEESDFQIIEDKVPQTIINFKPLSNLPIDVAMLMDTSNSVKPKLKFERDAAYSFLETVLKYRQDRALFATFDSQVELHQDLTNRLDLLTKAIDKIKAQGGTKMYDAIYSVCEQKMMSTASTGRRRVMVVLTDGEDTESERTLQDAIDIAQSSETTIYVISTKAGGFFGVQAGTVDRREDKDLKRLAEETGGRAFFTAEVIELEKSLTQITRELRNQYMIAYEPTNNNYDGKERKIEVKLPKHKGLKVRTKTGYKTIPRGAASASQ
ncbi:MAG TPA: VWA domain-containing protein [Blastocatellia bacterium]|jgi:Ca-activated chloride channel family protein|nr:VWA domain-containing protein [Blastocatellia bacterium]